MLGNFIIFKKSQPNEKSGSIIPPGELLGGEKLSLPLFASDRETTLNDFNTEEYPVSQNRNQTKAFNLEQNLQITEAEIYDIIGWPSQSESHTVNTPPKLIAPPTKKIRKRKRNSSANSQEMMSEEEKQRLEARKKKNRESARRSRAIHKKYVEALENDNRTMKEEITRLKEALTVSQEQCLNERERAENKEREFKQEIEALVKENQSLKAEIIFSNFLNSDNKFTLPDKMVVPNMPSNKMWPIQAPNAIF